MKKPLFFKILVTANMLFMVSIISIACSSKKATTSTYAEGKSYIDEDPKEKIKVREKKSKMPFDTSSASPQIKLNTSYQTE